MARKKHWRSVGCKVARDIRDNPSRWSYGTTVGIGQTVIETSTLRVTVTPCERCPCLRTFDQVRLYEVTPEGAQDVYVGRVSRICLRGAVRKYAGDRVAAL